MSIVKRPTIRNRRISSSPSPPGSPHPAYDPIRMEPVARLETSSAVPLSIKQVDLDGYDIVPPVPAFHNTFDLPASSFYSFQELQDDIAKAISAQNGIPHRRVEAKRDFYFKLSAHYRRHTDEKRQDVRVTAQNWDELRLLLLSDEVYVACFSVLWWKKTTGQRRADRAEALDGFLLWLFAGSDLDDPIHAFWRIILPARQGRQLYRIDRWNATAHAFCAPGFLSWSQQPNIAMPKADKLFESERYHFGE
ncbi:hypothetical protein KCU77_g21371, partial [Aureobasidium melanogenum]